MIDAEVASGLNAAFKAIDVVDGLSFIKNLLGDYCVGTKLDWRGAVRLDGWRWTMTLFELMLDPCSSVGLIEGLVGLSMMVRLLLSP